MVIKISQNYNKYDQIFFYRSILLDICMCVIFNRNSVEYFPRISKSTKSIET